MNTITFKVKRLGNHWYPDLEHYDPNDLSLDPKMEYFLSILARGRKTDCLTITLKEQSEVLNINPIIQFEEQDIVRYLTTDDTFFITIYIKDHPFYITSELYTLLEELFNLDFSNKMYTLEHIW